MRPLLITLLLIASPLHAAEQPGSPIAIGDSQMKLRLVLNKLGQTLQTNRELDRLERLGMPHREVERLKQALDMKVKQLTEDALYVIRSI